MNPHNNKNLIQTRDSLIHEYMIHHHIVSCYNIKYSNTAQCNITYLSLRLMGTKIMHMTMIIRQLLCSYHLINYLPLSIRSIVGAKHASLEISASQFNSIYNLLICKPVIKLIWRGSLGRRVNPDSVICIRSIYHVPYECEYPTEKATTASKLR